MSIEFALTIPEPVMWATLAVVLIVAMFKR
jgi:flagellar biosynthesis protein FliQ